MRKAFIQGYVIYDEREIYHGSVEGVISHELYNCEGIVEWEIIEVSNEEIQYKSEDEFYDEDE